MSAIVTLKANNANSLDFGLTQPPFHIEPKLKISFRNCLEKTTTDSIKNHNWTFKGQLISKCPFGVIVWTKIPTKTFAKFCPTYSRAKLTIVIMEGHRGV